MRKVVVCFFVSGRCIPGFVQDFVGAERRGAAVGIGVCEDVFLEDFACRVLEQYARSTERLENVPATAS